MATFARRANRHNTTMETFFTTHAFLIENLNSPIRRSLMDRIDWGQRVIGIKGPRGVGKTTFLLQYAKEHFDLPLRQCLYINMNNFYFQGRGIVDFAEEFIKYGGKVLLIDQAFKHPDWCQEILTCYERFPSLRIVYTTSSVERYDKDFEALNRIGHCYCLHGFSFREFVNLQTNAELRSYSMEELLRDHEQILKNVLPLVRPWNYLQAYLHHGYYPLFTETRNFSDNLLKSINMMLEVDVLFIKQIELKYLSRIKKLLYLLATAGTMAPNISKLAEEVKTSRATVMNYIKDLEEARLINLVYKEGESFPKKPAQIMAHNTNLMYSVYPEGVSEQEVMETFFTNSLWRHHSVNAGKKPGCFRIDGKYDICICDKNKRVRNDNHTIYAKYNTEVGRGNEIPLWLFGFLY